MKNTIETRLKTLNAVLPNEKDQKAVKKEFLAVDGDWTKVSASLKEKLPQKTFQKASFAYSLADWSNDHVKIVKALAEWPKLTSMRDVALRYNPDKLVEIVDPENVPETTSGTTPAEKTRNFAIALHRKLFIIEPSAVLQRMVHDGEIAIPDASVSTGVERLLSNLPDFNIRTTSVYKAFKKPEAFNGIADDHRAGIVEKFKNLSRVVAISPVPEAVPVLMKVNLTSALHVAEMPESTFLKTYGNELGEETARQVYTNAINSHIRNENALITMLEAVRGTGLAAIDGKKSMKVLMAEGKKIAHEKDVQIDLETLFGSMDYCECGECNSVYSPAAYFVELLQFLRNNNLDPNNPNIGKTDIVGTPLEMLFRRRPDLGCLELTCENTNTVLPYVDLVNEVMESFVVHLGEYGADTNDPKQAKLEVFNVIEETSGELLAQPQHINYDAYCILKNAVYPFTLPYHQPIDAIRIFLNYLGTSYYELLKRFRTANETCGDLSSAEQDELNTLHKVILDRAIDAEFLGLTQEEYIILTKEAFWPKRYFEITQKKTYTDDKYRQNVGVKPFNEYYGYESEADMLSIDESSPPKGQKGLTFVKKQFLPRTGILYVDLVELLKTRFINPIYPQGKALTLMESIRFSYRFLQSLVDTKSTDPKIRFAKVIDFLEKAQCWLPQLDAILHPDPCQQHQKSDYCVESEDLRRWVYCNFDKLGKLIVLESGEPLQLPIEGQIWGQDVIVGTLRKDGTIVDDTGAIIGHVELTIGTYKSSNNEVVDKNGIHIGYVSGSKLKDNEIVPTAYPVSWVDEQKFKDQRLSIMNGDQEVGFIFNNELYYGPNENILFWLPAKDTCNLDKVRLRHLDGTTVNVDEYDRMQRFIRLWHKMDWTIDETDKALIGLAACPTETGTKPTTVETCQHEGFDTFKDDCGSYKSKDDYGCPDTTLQISEIIPDFLHELVAVRKLLDLTGLPLDKLLTFWADISTSGEKSLYSRLFLTHNLLAIDKVFEADKDGNYLTQSAKLTEHVPVLMAALRLKADDISAIIAFRKLPDELTLHNISVLYRHSLLAKILHVKVSDLPDMFTLFGDPFVCAKDTIKLLKTWGKMEDAGFTFRQLNYFVQNHDDALHPLGPAKKTVLQISKTLYDGLNAIDRDNPDIHEDKKDQSTSDLIRTKAGFIFEQQVVEQIIGLFEGTTVYTTNAPANQTITIPDSLAKKLKYINQKNAIPPNATLQVTGILTETEKMQAKTLCPHPDWSKAIDRVSKQPQNIFNDILFGIFKDVNDAKAKLLTGDIFPPDGDTALDKRFYFLQNFLPFLRQRLVRKFLIDTMSGAAGVASDVTEVLLSEILVVGTPPQSAMSALENVKETTTGSTGGWKGYLIPSAEGNYAFVAIGDTQPAPLSIDGKSIPFPNQQEDPSNVWSTDSLPLKAGTLYWLELTDRTADQLQWKTSGSPKAAIPASVLLPDHIAKGTEEVFTKLYKAAILVNGFNLSAEEVSYLQTHAADFDAFDFNTVKLKHWQRLQAYTDLRNNLPKLDTTLLDLFKWSNQPDDPTKLSEKISTVTGWNVDRVKKLLTADHFDLKPGDFNNEVNIVKLKKAIAVTDKINVDIDRLFVWAKPGSKFWEHHQIAEDIRNIAHARFDQEDWEQVVKPLNDKLRENQKQALISYLVVQKDLIDWGVVDADSLFEFFLIDVQMDPCMETSRIKQAISTVQLFIQRCLMGLEEDHVPNKAIDRKRWEWMQKYRVREANCKVFLYPENWIEPHLRDDKSVFYKELESELLQKDINTQTVQDALKSYLFKVDEVANLKVVGLFIEQIVNKDENGKPSYKLHVFSRTRNAPYFFYYRYFHSQEGNWYPWEKMQVDVPTYDVEDNDGQISESGTYLIPVVWNKRLLIFFPQFMKKTSTNSTSEDTTYNDFGSKKPKDVKAIESWEIKMAWSEYRNGKWTQKQVSADAIYDLESSDFTSVPKVNSYEFVPRIFTNDPKVVIDIYRGTGALGAFSFAGSQLYKDNTLVLTRFPPFNLDFHYENQVKIYSLQTMVISDPPFFETPFFETEPFFDVPKTSVTVVMNRGSAGLNFYHPFAHDLLGKLTAGNLDDLFAYYLNKFKPDVPDALKDDTYGADPKAKYHELKRSYSLYIWEAGFHAPMQLVDRLLKSQHFDQALNMCHYIFNPLAEGTDLKRFWQFPPFKEIDSTTMLEQLFMGLQPNTPDKQINEWRNNPFQPHVVARSRPLAYMKWVVMKYIEILIAYGDYYFRQNTLETIPMAIQCYVLAAHIYGPRGQKIPKRGKILPQTYNSLLDKWDAFSNAMVEMELAFPFSNQIPLPIGVSNGAVGLANVFGFATSLYFCIPDNPNLKSLRDTIDDRLFKIRHCEDIEGVFRKLPLFEPPIEPGLLVQAAAQGISISSVLNDLNSPMPNYRFYYLLQKALELCSEIKALGNAFLSTKEKGDAEALSQLRAKHESSIQNLVMEVRKQQLEESQKSIDALQQSRKVPVYRLQYYLKLIGEDLDKVPADGNTDFGELPNSIEKPVDESGLKLIPYEKEEMDKAARAADGQVDIGRIESIASILHAIPSFGGHVMPFGVGLSMTVGGSNFGSALQGIARWMQTDNNKLSFEGTNAGRKGGFLRQLQDRIQQANIAGYDIKNIDKQILTQQIRRDISQQEITNQQKQIDNAQEVEEFLRNKYTNADLYSWMEGSIRTLYYQAYTLAYDLAKRAEKVYRFERGLTTSNFIQFGYWDATHDGLLAGERMYIALKQLEAAYQEKRGYDYEVTKHVSLRQVNPLAFIELKETGTCKEFALPEVLFDMDHPGHYMRRIKSVALTVPCVIGPYTSLNCTLRLLEHKFRINAIAKDKNDYREKTEEPDDRFSTVNVPITSIAVSTGQNDSGVFELNFRDERYIPFEGAGAISKWRIELPAEFRQFDYDTISDVILHLRYTAVDGGDKLKVSAAGSVQDYIKNIVELSQHEGLFAAFDLKHDFPDEWYKATNPPTGATERVLKLSNIYEKLPLFTKGRPPAKIRATDMYLFTPAALTASTLVLTQDTAEYTFKDGQPVGTMKSFVTKERPNNVPMDNWQLSIRDVKTGLDNLWLIVRYKLPS